MAGQIRRQRRTMGRSSYQPVMKPLKPMLGNAGLRSASENARQTIENIDSLLKEANPEFYEGSPSDVLRQEQQAARGVAPGQPSGSGMGSGVAVGAGAAGSSITDGGAAAGGGSSATEGSTGQSGSARSNLKGKEEAIATSGGLYQEGGEQQKKKGAIAKYTASISRKRLAVLAVSMVLTVASGILAVFSSLLPLKTLSIAQYVEDKAYAAFNNATQEGMERLMTAYIKNHVMPSLLTGKCQSTRVNRSCMQRIDTSDPISALFARWQGRGQQSLETKLAERGYEISRVNGRFRMTIPGAPTLDVNGVETGREPNITRLMTRAEVRANFRTAIEGEAFFKRAMFRFRIGALLERKYGIERCVRSCNFQDKFNDKVSVKKRAFQAYFIRRFVQPRSAMLGVALGCLLNACADTATSGGVNDPNSVENGEPTDEFDRQTREALRNFRLQFGSDKIDKLVANLGEIDKDGIGRYILKEMIKKGGSLVGRQINDEIAKKLAGPFAWALALGKVLYFVENGGQALKKIVYDVNSSSMVAVFYLFMTIAHEQKSGHMEAQAYGSFANGLTSGYGDTGQPAEASPMYDTYFSSSATAPIAAAIKSILPQKAYAAPAPGTEADVKANQAKCNDKTPVQANQEVGIKASNNLCPELRLSAGNWLTEFSDFLLNSPLLGGLISLIGTIAHWIDAVADSVIGAFTDVIEPLFKTVFPQAYDTLVTVFGYIAQQVTEFMIRKIVPPLIPPDGVPDGARIVDLLIGGGTVAGSESAHRLLGGKVLDTQEQVVIQNEQMQKQQEQFASKSLYDRMFDTNDTQSFVSQLALATPSNPGYALQSTLSSLLSNPIGVMGKYFAGAVGTNSAYAAPIDNAFGIAQYGIPLSNEAFQQDPVEYYKTNCADGKMIEAYNTDKALITDPALKKYGWTKNPDTLQIQNDEPAPCFMWNQLANYDQIPADSGNGGGGTGGAFDNSTGVPTCATTALTSAPPGYTLVSCDDFEGTSLDGSTFSAYNGGGGDTVSGAGRRPEQCTVANSVFTLTQASNGATCGSTSSFNQKEGYWEVRMQTAAIDGGKSTAHPVLILWPGTNKWADGELDYFETNIGDDGGGFLHCVGNPSANCYVIPNGGNTALTPNAAAYSQWISYGLEWTSSSMTGFINGQQWWTSTDSSFRPNVPMHQTIQLDNLSGDNNPNPSRMQADWVHVYKKN
jgi:hypothetical protein